LYVPVDVGTQTGLHPRAARGLGCQVDVKEPGPSRLVSAVQMRSRILAAPDKGRVSRVQCAMFLFKRPERGREETGSDDEKKSHRSRALVPNHLREDTRDTRCPSHSMQAGDRNG
jgi:hypothetical protein